MAESSVTPTQKTCRECGETKPVAAFERNRLSCRTCRRAYTKAWKKGFRKGRRFPIVDGTYKVCSQCGVLKPLDAFRQLRGATRSPEARRSECKACAALYDHAYHAHHPEERARLWQRYYAANLPRMLARASASYHANKDRRQFLHKLWNAANPERVLAHCTSRRLRKRALPWTLTPEDIRFCRQFFYYACAVCGREEAFDAVIAMDHWIPLSSPDCPGTTPLNTIPLCHGENGCNNSKGTKEPQAWLIQRFGTRQAAKILTRIERYFVVIRQRLAVTRSNL
jgi:hypothetical protein